MSLLVPSAGGLTFTVVENCHGCAFLRPTAMNRWRRLRRATASEQTCNPERITHMTLCTNPAEYQARALRAHDLLHDVPLEDVWAIRLPGGGPGRTIHDLRPLFS